MNAPKLIKRVLLMAAVMAGSTAMASTQQQCHFALSVASSVKQPVTFNIQSFLSGPIAKVTLHANSKSVVVPCRQMYEIQVTTGPKGKLQHYAYVNPYGTQQVLFPNNQYQQTIQFSPSSQSFKQK